MERSRMSAINDQPRIYLAGPEVFLPNAKEIGAAKAALCADAGCVGAFPLDQSLDLSGLTKLEQARRIALGNEGLMRSCDALIANLTPFRGVSMDSGTAFEVGFMRALGRPVFGYTNVAGHYYARTKRFRTAAVEWSDSDRPDIDIEDFDLAENLMIDIALRETGLAPVCTTVPRGEEMTDLTGFKACLAAVVSLFGQGSSATRGTKATGS
jgi:nucleoside 2-deoxyribosyltransferase